MSRLPVPVRAASLVRSLLPPAPRRGRSARLLAEAAEEAGLSVRGARGDGVLVVEPSLPEVRAAACARLTRRFGRAATPRLLTVPEYVLWSRGPGRRGAETPADIGEFPPPPPAERDVDRRRRLFRHASGLLLHDLPGALSSRTGGAEQAYGLTLALRRTLEQLGPPRAFPPLPGPTARARELWRTALGAAHVAFGSSELEEPGPALEPQARAEAPSRSAATMRSIFAAMLADLGGPTRRSLQSLLLLPGSVGTRHQWTLIGLVADDTPLHRAAAIRDALQGHLGMLPARPVEGGLRPAGPVVLTQGILRAMLRGRLFRRPLRRLSARLHRVVLLGSDPLASHLGGIDASDDDRRSEIGALLHVSSGAWRDSTAIGAQDLVFGAWPAALHHAAHLDPHASQQGILETMARRTDPALARVGSVTNRGGWGDPFAADRGRPDAFLRDWGPALVRLQEVAVESLQ